MLSATWKKQIYILGASKKPEMARSKALEQLLSDPEDVATRTSNILAGRIKDKQEDKKLPICVL